MPNAGGRHSCRCYLYIDLHRTTNAVYSQLVLCVVFKLKLYLTTPCKSNTCTGLNTLHSLCYIIHLKSLLYRTVSATNYAVFDWRIQFQKRKNLRVTVVKVIPRPVPRWFVFEQREVQCHNARFSTQSHLPFMTARLRRRLREICIFECRSFILCFYSTISNIFLIILHVDCAYCSAM